MAQKQANQQGKKEYRSMVDFQKTLLSERL